jgi:hypothetical protein
MARLRALISLIFDSWGAAAPARTETPPPGAANSAEIRPQMESRVPPGLKIPYHSPLAPIRESRCSVRI